MKFDASIVIDARLEDPDAEGIPDYRAALTKENPSAEALRWTNAEPLEAIGAVRSKSG